MLVIPAILEQDFQSILAKLVLIRGVTDRIQIDLCDGRIGAVKTWLPNPGEMLPEGFLYDFDIMLYDWKIPTANALLQKASSIIAHVDNYTDEDLATLVAMVKPYNVPLGLSVSNDTSYAFHSSMLKKAKLLYENVFVQVMGIRHIGQQAQPFDEEVITRIKAFKEDFKDIVVQVDGGVNPSTVRVLHEAGADIVVAGSSIFGAFDTGIAYENLKRVIG